MQNTNGDSLKIAILDTGLKKMHPAIVGKQAEVYCLNEQEDGFVIGDNVIEDSYGHGTAIYNIYRSQLPLAHITCYKIQEIDFADDDNSLIKTLCLILQLNLKFDIINISLGTHIFDKELYLACSKLYYSGTIIVSAFDNNGAISYPAAFPFVIGVTSSAKCRTNTMIEYVHSDIVNVCANGNYQRLAWVSPDYIMLEGNSFACAHVGVLIGKIICKGIISFSNIKSELIKLSNVVIKPKKNNMFSNVKKFKIARAAILPFNKEIHSLIRFGDILPFEIVDIYDFKYSPYIGAKTAHLLKNEALPINMEIKNVDQIDWDQFDTLIIGHLNEYQQLLKNDELQTDLIKQALQHCKKIFAFDENKDFKKNDNVYSPVISKGDLPINYFGKLYTLNKPIVGVFGTSSKQGKYSLQLALRKEFQKRELKLGQIATEPSGELFGMEYSYPIGYNASVRLSDSESIVYVNYILNCLCQKDIDLILIGSQSNTVPYNFGNLSYYPLTQINFLMASQPDAVILCVNPYDSNEYINRTIKTIENLSGATVIALVIFPMKFRDGIGGIYSSKIKMNFVELSDLKKSFLNEHNLPVYILDDNIAKCLCDDIISFLS